jgi:hypothetical protein
MHRRRIPGVDRAARPEPRPPTPARFAGPFGTALLFFFLFAACAPGTDRPAELEVERWDAEETLRIGSVDDPDQALTRVGPLALGPQGHLYVAQPGERLVRVFDEAGRPVRTIGREGDGPGELRSLFYLGFLADTLHVTDVALRRTSFYSADGRFLRTESVTSPAIGEEYLPTPPFRFLPDGSAVVSPMFPVGTVERHPYLRIDREGRVLDTLAWQPLEGRRLTLELERMTAAVDLPFPDAPMVVLMIERERVAEIAWSPEPGGGPARGTAEFGVTWTTFEGDTLAVRRYPYRPLPLDPAEEGAVLARMSTAPPLSSIYPDPDEAERVLRGMDLMPELLPPVSAAVATPAGGLWLAREADGRDTRSWLILDPEGEPRGQVELPAGLHLRVVRGAEAWGVETDELDVPYVVRYRILEPSHPGPDA